MDLPDSTTPELPRFYANGAHFAVGPYDLALTFIDAQLTVMPEEQVGPHQAKIEARVQVVMSLGQAKAMIPLLVQAISQYEQQFGVIPAPGFDEDSKQ
jgi:hypothetical protein